MLFVTRPNCVRRALPKVTSAVTIAVVLFAPRALAARGGAIHVAYGRSPFVGDGRHLGARGRGVRIGCAGKCGGNKTRGADWSRRYRVSARCDYPLGTASQSGKCPY